MTDREKADAATIIAVKFGFKVNKITLLETGGNRYMFEVCGVQYIAHIDRINGLKHLEIYGQN